MIEQRHICDTCIWYDFESGAIQPASDVKLVGTYLSLIELCLSRRIKTNYDLVRRIAKKIVFDNNIALNPLPHNSHVHYLVHKTFGEKDDLVRTFENIANGLRLTDAGMERLIQQCETYCQSLKVNTASVNSVALKAKLESKSSDEIREQNLKPAIISTLIKSVNDYCKGPKIDEGSLNWNKLELFICTYEVWAKRLATGALVAVENDWIDFLQLIYVQPGNLYWTKDGKWKDMITEAGMGHYLYKK